MIEARPGIRVAAVRQSLSLSACPPEASAAAFTLIELLVVIAIIAILAGIPTPIARVLAVSTHPIKRFSRFVCFVVLCKRSSISCQSV